jgi:hypothetical protein
MVTFQSLSCNAAVKRWKKTGYYFIVEKTRFNLQRTQLASESGNFLFCSSQLEGKHLRHTVAAKITKASR